MRITFSIITESHSRLAQTNCVFAFTDAIELLELGLIDALHCTELGDRSIQS